MAKKKTACLECVHHLMYENDHTKQNIWSHYCMATPSPLKFDFLTGEEVNTNKCGWAHCNAVNMGACPKFARSFMEMTEEE